MNVLFGLGSNEPERDGLKAFQKYVNSTHETSCTLVGESHP